MQLDPKSLTTPSKIDQKVSSFCRKLSSATPVFIEVTPEIWCRQSCCEMNVEKLIEQLGGKKVHGYKIWYVKGKYIEAERHTVYEHEGILRDPTFNVDGEQKILFVRDYKDTKGYDDRPLKIREGFTQKARLLANQLNERDTGVITLSKEESWDVMPSYEDWLAGSRQPNMWAAPKS